MLIKSIIFSLTIIELNGYVRNFKTSIINRKVHALNSPYIDDWSQINDCEVFFPRNQRVPHSIIHFIGGFIAGSFVSLGYLSLLQYLSEKGHLVIATPIPPLEFDHEKVASATSASFSNCCKTLLPTLGSSGYSLPVIGMGHSLGGKLLALISSSSSLTPNNKYDANVFISFNNFGSKDSLHMSKSKMSSISPEIAQLINTLTNLEMTDIVNKVRDSSLGKILDSVINFDEKIGTNQNNNPYSKSFDALFGSYGSPFIKEQLNEVNKFAKQIAFEFSPAPDATWRIIQSSYGVKYSIIFKFRNDDIDQSIELASRIRRSSDSSGTRMPAADGYKRNTYDIERVSGYSSQAGALGAREVQLVTVPGTHVTPNHIESTDPDFDTFVHELGFQLSSLLQKIEAENQNPNRASSSSSSTLAAPSLLPPGSTLTGNSGSGSTGGSAETGFIRWEDDNF